MAMDFLPRVVSGVGAFEDLATPRDLEIELLRRRRERGESCDLRDRPRRRARESERARRRHERRIVGVDLSSSASRIFS
jgi:hypothetical protein